MRFYVVFAILILVVGCAKDEGLDSPMQKGEEPVIAEEDMTQDTSQADVAAAPDLVPEAEPEPLPDPSMLLGKSPRDIVTLLGDAGLVRLENHVQIFQYTGEACVLDVVFYEDGEDGFISRYYEARSGQDAKTVDGVFCLDEILKIQAGAS